MTYLFRGTKRELREKVRALHADGLDIAYKGEELRVVLSRKKRAERYVFSASAEETDAGCTIAGEIVLTGTPWRWYDYLFSVLLCLLVFPALLLLAVPATFGGGYYAGGGTPDSRLPFFSPSKREREKRLKGIMALFTEETP